MTYSRLRLHGNKEIWEMKMYSGGSVKTKTIKSISLQAYQKRHVIWSVNRTKLLYY